MKDYKLKIFAGSACFIIFMMIWGWFGDIDYTEQVILSMTQEEYDSVSVLLKEKNGCQPSEREIAHWWAEHHFSR